jgi:hypothetical protein
MLVSATLGLNGATHEDPVASVECVTHTVDARVQVTQNLPAESWSIVADSDPPLRIVLGNPEYRVHDPLPET